MSKKFEFIRNQKGENTLIRKGFHHNKNVTNKNGTTQWRCVNRKLCGASITIDKSRKKILRETKHCCTGNKDKIKLHNIKESLKTAVCNDLGPIQIIFEREVEEMGVAALVSYKSVKHSLYRARKNFLNTNFLNYSSTENVHIPEVLGKKFLICEDGDVEKILIFATKLGRKLMRKRGLMFFADGTFKAAPKPFYQLYVLHVDLGSSKKATNIVPVIYVLLPNKTEQTYTRLFKLLKEKLMIKIRNFKSDYEKAQMNAVSKIFPEAKISGCFYHYNHAIWRYSKRIKLNATRKGRNVTRMCSLMPLVPADRIPEVFLDQCRLLTEIKDEISESKCIIEKSEQAQSKFIAELLKQALSENSSDSRDLEPVNKSSFNSRARSLLDAIETKQGFSLDREMRVALVNCLQSEELKERMVSATAASVREMLRGNFSREMSRLYIPILQRAHRRLSRQLTRAIEDAFAELESHSAQLTNSMCGVSRSLRRALQHHQGLLHTGKGGRFSYMQYVVEETLQKEMKQWRHLAVEALCTETDKKDSAAKWAERGATPPPEYPISPPQPANPDSSIIDQLMTTAEINKQIQDGDINAAFERALSAADLSLVMVACRAVDPALVFTPCRLQQSTLLSLAQQLPTDMVHDTQLKCRYIEEAIINLDPKHPATSAHLPLVVGEIHKHLTKFLAKYPSHIANRRITLIIMAAEDLLK